MRSATGDTVAYTGGDERDGRTSVTVSGATSWIDHTSRGSSVVAGRPSGLRSETDTSDSLHSMLGLDSGGARGARSVAFAHGVGHVLGPVRGAVITWRALLSSMPGRTVRRMSERCLYEPQVGFFGSIVRGLAKTGNVATLPLGGKWGYGPKCGYGRKRVANGRTRCRTVYTEHGTPTSERWWRTCQWTPFEQRLRK